MPDCIAIRHVAFEDLGLLAPPLVARGFSLRYLEAGIDDIDAATLAAPDLVIVLGGPIGVYEEDLFCAGNSPRSAPAWMRRSPRSAFASGLN